MRHLKGLTSKQDEVAKHNGSHARIIAGPGTGKSRTLIYHIVHSISNHNINPKSMLVLAFNRSIAEKLKEDLSKFIDNGEMQLPIIMTLHSYALKLLKRFRIASELGNATFPSENEMPTIHKVICRYLKQKNVEYKGSKITISKVSNELFTLYAKNYWYGVKLEDNNTLEVLKYFDEALNFTKDFFGIRFLGELPSELRKLLATEPESRKCYDKIVIDEYQDLNLEDIALAKAIAQEGAEVIIAGDDDQSICSYRGVNSQGLRTFEDEYEKVISYELDECFRCPKNIFEYAQKIIKQIPEQERIQKTMVCSSSFEGSIMNWRFKTPESQRDSIAKIVKSYIDNCDYEFTKGKGKSNKSLLIIVQRKRYVKDYIEDLKSLGLEVEDITSWKPDENIMKFWFFLRAMINPSDQLALQNILGLKEPRWEKLFDKLLGKIDWNKYRQNLETYLNNHGAELNSAVKGENKKALENTYSIIKVIKECQNDVQIDVADIKRSLIDVSNKCGAFFSGYKDEKVLIAIDEVVDQIEKLNVIIKEPFDILAYFLPIIDEKPQPNPEIKVEVTTLRKAKGLEADFVILPDLENNVLPGNLDLAEAIRLLYVGVTRSKRLLLISSVKKRIGGYSSGDPSIWKKPSELLPNNPQVEKGEEEAAKILSNIELLNSVR